MKKIRELLVKHNICIDNEYLDKYIEILENSEPERIKFVTQDHHVVPRCYFRHNN